MEEFDESGDEVDGLPTGTVDGSGENESPRSHSYSPAASGSPAGEAVVSPALGQPLLVVHLPVLCEAYLAALYAADLGVPLRAGVDLLHRLHGVHLGVRFEMDPGVRAEVFQEVLLEVGLSLRPEVDREVRREVDPEVRPGVIPVVMLGADLGVLREVGR